MTSENDILKSMLDVAECAIACCQIIFRDDKTDYKIISFNSAFEALSGHDRSWLLGRCLGDKSIRELFLDSDPAEWITQAIAKRSTESIFYIGNKSYEISGHKLGEDLLIITLFDVTERQSYKQKFELAFNSTNSLQSLTTFKEGEEGLYVEVNDIICSTIGLPREEIIGRSWLSVSALENPADYFKIMNMVSRDKKIDNFELAITNKRGEKRIGLMSCEAVHINNQDFTFSVIHDITEFRRIENELAEKNQQLTELNHLLSQQVIRDDLTGLNNRRQIFTILHEEIERSNRYGYSLSLMMMDLDNFKEINDSYGHRFGDYVLQGVVRIILKNIRENDRMGRYGGDEFLLILPHTDVQSAKSLAQRVISAIEQKSFGKNKVKVTISIGLCGYHGSSLKEFVERADTLMYQAKKTGRNKYVSE